MPRQMKMPEKAYRVLQLMSAGKMAKQKAITYLESLRNPQSFNTGPVISVPLKKGVSPKKRRDSSERMKKWWADWRKNNAPLTADQIRERSGPIEPSSPPSIH